MPTVRRRVSVGAGLTNANLISDAPERFCGPRGSQVTLYAVASAVDFDLAVRIGQTLKQSLGELGVEAAAGRGPITPDDLIGQWVGLPGEEILLEASNRAGAAVEGAVKVEITHL